MIEHEYLKRAVVLLQEETVEAPAVEVAEVPPVPKEDVPSPISNGDDHPVKELAEPVEEEITEVSVPKVCPRLFI